jgi:hypothetical protein
MTFTLNCKEHGEAYIDSRPFCSVCLAARETLVEQLLAAAKKAKPELSNNEAGDKAYTELGNAIAEYEASL